MLPQDFLERMQTMLGGEYPLFLASYENEKYQALRLNRLKTTREEFLERVPFALTPVPWAEDGFYYGGKDTPGKYPLHEAGVYYIQEPSAMAPAAYLGAEPGEKILDLCAAPGGKSTQIAAAMQGKGLLVCNEIHPARAKILSENIERMGIRNALVTNETPQRLSGVFEEYFDRIMVDAPCSGEGMFRKNEEAGGEWSLANVELCAARQAEILDCAASMLRRGGRLVYSTCTFAPAENEGSISRFIERHPEFSIVKAAKTEGMAEGNPAWCSHPAANMEDTIRLWPHRLKGEGHYVAVLEKKGEVPEGYRGYCRTGEQKGMPEKEYKEYTGFCDEFLRTKLCGTVFLFGEQLYLAPEGMPAIKGLKVLRPGLHLGTMKKKRFEPAHALALALNPGEVKNVMPLSASGNEVRMYLNGQTLPYEGEKGWYLVTADGYGIGWGKLAGGVMKNHYPKGLRINYKN